MAGRGADDQTLPSKEANLFRQIVKFYETKQYKKGIKAADQILKKFPEHGETLAMKGLTLNCLEKKEEAYDLVRKGLKANLRSHVCWHVYGLLYRSDRNYAEAIKCYVNALRMDKDNVQILRDLALLQVQMRDTAGFVETRQKLLQQKPANRNNWISFAIAHHLNKSYEVAVQVLDSYEGTLEEVPASEAYEHSEMLLYKATILEEAGKFEDSLKVLDSAMAADKVKDITGLHEQKARLLLEMQRLDDAQKAYRELLAQNPDNTKYHEALLRCVGLVPSSPGGAWSDQERVELTSLYLQLQEQFPRSIACKRMPLDFLVGSSFSDAATSYVKRFLAKGIPSLFSDLKGLYTDSAKMAALQELFEGLEQRLEAGSEDIPGLKPEDCSEVSSDNPGPLAWVRIYLAQHFDRLRETAKALTYAEKVITAAPDLIEGYSVKAKILKHAGDLEGASAAAEKARKMDLADRYLNSTSAKAMFRAGHIQEAEATAALFTKDNDQVNNLYDMQCMWYEIECGRAHQAKNDRGKALKNYVAVTKHFADFIEDQFDFHSYCVRKMTLRSYISLLKLEDRILSNRFYSRAALAAIDVYLDLHRNPDNSEADRENEEALMAAMDPAERKRYKAKKRKEEARRRREAEEAEAAAAAAAAAKEKEKGKKGPAAKVEKDPDPDGKQLAATEDPVGEAAKLVAELKVYAAKEIATHTAAFEVYLRKGRLLLALQAAQAALALGGSGSPEAFRLSARLAHACSKIPDPGAEGTTHPVVHAVLTEDITALLGGKDLISFVKDWVAKYGRGTSLPCAGAAAEMLALVLPAQKAEAVQLLLSFKIGPKTTLAECIEAYELLVGALGDPAAAASFKKAAAEPFRWSTFLEGPDRQEGAATTPAADITANGIQSLKV
mmetsp:Transcript_31747/g.90154  ORF Transcript_31747/g.90154 Transcript_31747/m.90154 type:complete len:895 (+) Transcript_31747:199-2883(+)